MTSSLVPAVRTTGAMALPSERAGFEGLSGADLQVPFLNQVQKDSPETDKTGTKFIPGAEPGMFFNSVTRELFPTEVEIIPVTVTKAFVEWKPRNSGGGFQGVHAENSPEVREAMARNGGKIIQNKGGKVIGLTTPDGNELVQTFYLFALVVKGDAVESLVVIPFSKTKVKPFREYTTLVYSTPPATSLGLNRARLTGWFDRRPAGNFWNVALAPTVKEGTLIERVRASRLDPASSLAQQAEAFRLTVVQGRAAVSYESTEATGEGTPGDAVFG